MSASLSNQKIAVLVANGFNEHDLVEMQKAVLPYGGMLRIVGMNHGLINSWNGEGWGLNFAADKVLNSALSSDFSALIIPGGQRSIEKLQLTAHTQRFINGFLDTHKPVVAMGEATELMLKTGKMAGMTMTGPAAMQAEAEAAGATWSGESWAVDGNVMSGNTEVEDRAAMISAVMEFLHTSHNEDKQAA